jgi:hypothetical protein
VRSGWRVEVERDVTKPVETRSIAPVTARSRSRSGVSVIVMYPDPGLADQDALRGIERADAEEDDAARIEGRQRQRGV